MRPANANLFPESFVLAPVSTVIYEFFRYLADWGPIDTGIVVTAALAAMACAVPGVFLLLRRQSMMGDALSHTALLGVVGAFLAAHALRSAGWITGATEAASRHLVMFVGAMAIGVLAAVMTEAIQRLGRVEATAALGVVFTTLFALGLLLMRLYADSVHLDPDCFLYGTVETSYLGVGVPEAAIANGCVLLLNLAVVALLFKELKVSAFDPALATALGINARAMHYGLMAVTAATVVAAFESVGVILVIAMLITPAATAHLLTDRLGRLILVALAVAALSAILGHAMAITLPAIVFSRLGFPEVRDASTAGMMSVAGGLLFGAAALFSPRHGILVRAWRQSRLGLRIAAEDVLGHLYRLEERSQAPATATFGRLHGEMPGIGRLLARIAVWELRWNRQLSVQPEGYQLTDAGRAAAEGLVRAHRLWESYIAKHFLLPADHLHEPASRVEHYLGPELREQLAGELKGPVLDPHGAIIPDESSDEASTSAKPD